MNKEPVSETKENILKEGYHIHLKASNVKMKIWKPSSTFILPRNRQSQKHQSPKRAAQKPKDNTWTAAERIQTRKSTKTSNDSEKPKNH